MGNKNISSGDINTDGGSVHIGDNITNIIEHLSLLLKEYAEQLKDIESLIKSFKPRTALELLRKLEERVNALDLQRKNKVEGMLFYLKALCKKDLQSFDSNEVFKDFLRAYQLDKHDRVLQRHALMAYINLKDHPKATTLVQSILSLDEYDVSAWFAKLVLSGDVPEFIKSVPAPVLKHLTFQISTLYYLLERDFINSIEEGELYDLDWKTCLQLDNSVTYSNRDIWTMVIDIRFNDFTRKNAQYLNFHEDFYFEEKEEITALIGILKRYINALKNTEVSEAISHQKYILYFLLELTTRGKKYTEELIQAYRELPQNNWFYAGRISQILIRNDEPQKCLEVIGAYEDAGGQLNPDFYLLKFLCYCKSKDSKGKKEVFDDYLRSIESIGQGNAYNIINTLVRELLPDLTEEALIEYFDLLNSKPFLNPEIKTIFQISFRVRYLKEPFSIELFEQLIALTKTDDFDIPWKGILAENLNNIGKRKDAIIYLDGIVNKEQVSDILHFYIQLLYEQLLDKEDEERGRYKELLHLLRFWRLNSPSVNEQFLGFEHNLYTEIHDLDNLKEVDKLLYESFPENERYLLMYLSILDNKGDDAEIEKIAQSIPDNFKDEKIGIRVSGILSRRNEKRKGFNILYNLASNPQNTIARSSYFSSSLMFSEFSERYDEVKMNTWVVFTVEGKKQKKYISEETGLQGDLLNKKVGESFVATIPLTGKIVHVVIVEVFNDALNLFREIVDEAKNPLNDLGIQSFDLPTNTDDIKQALIQQLGAIGTKEKESKEQFLAEYYSYKKGFTEVTKFVFKNSHLDAYLNLTNNPDFKFTTLPNAFTTNVDIEHPQDFILDFSTLLLFHNLDKELGFEPRHKFLISPLIKREIENDLLEVKYAPHSEMSLQITLDDVKRNVIAKDYKQKRSEFLQSILNWMETNCIVTTVEEKLDVVPKLKQNEHLANDYSVEMLTDYMYLSSREKCRLISSDSTLFLFKSNDNLYHNILNPEKYLSTYFPDKMDTTFYRYLLRSNYIGIHIKQDTLKNEFYDFLSGRENYYLSCLENLKFSLHGNLGTIHTVVKFLKELYLMSALRNEDKNRHALQIIKSMSYGMNIKQLLHFVNSAKQEFKLMGDKYDEILAVIEILVKG
jgi:hypothetical protein